MTAPFTARQPSFGPRGLLDVQTPAPRGLLDISRFDTNIRQSATDTVRTPRLPPLPTLTAPRETNYDGLSKVFEKTGQALDAQNLGTAGLLASRAIKKPAALPEVAQTVKALDDVFFKWAGRVLTPAEEAAGAAADIQKGVPAPVAIPGAALRTGSRFLAGAASGAATGAAVGFFFPPPHPLAQSWEGWREALRQANCFPAGKRSAEDC
jgi:hypothetical protein